MNVSRTLAPGLIALMAIFSIAAFAVPAAATVCGGSITPPYLSTTVASGSTTIQTWSFSWTGVTPSSTITVSIATSNSAWTVSVLPTSVNSGSGTGSTSLTVKVIAPSGSSSTQITVTTSNGSCAITNFASGSGIFVSGVPQFGLPVIAASSVGLLGLVLLRKRTSLSLK